VLGRTYLTHIRLDIGRGIDSRALALPPTPTPSYPLSMAPPSSQITTGILAVPSSPLHLYLDPEQPPSPPSLGQDDDDRYLADNIQVSTPLPIWYANVLDSDDNLEEDYDQDGPNSPPDNCQLDGQSDDSDSEPFIEPIELDGNLQQHDIPSSPTSDYGPPSPLPYVLPDPQQCIATGLFDIIKRWPTSIPNIIANPSKNALVTDYILGSMMDDVPFLERMIQMHTLHLAAANVPRNTVEYTLKTLINVVDTCQKKARMIDPDSEPLLSDSPAQTLRTIRHQTGSKPPIMVYPVCPNLNCNELLYDLRSPTSFYDGKGLPPNCPQCGQDIRPIIGKPVADFPVISLKHELEGVLAHPGIEELTFNWQERRRITEQLDHHRHPGLKIYRDQWSGTHLDTILGPSGNPLLLDTDVPVIYVNLFLDWVNLRSSMASPGQSIGHIGLQVVNIPQGLRSVQSLILLLGIIPGKQKRKWYPMPQIRLTSGSYLAPYRPART
jgi:hypothetical protein